MQQTSKPGAVRVTPKEAPNQGPEADYSDDAQNFDDSLDAKDYGGLRTVTDAQGDAGISAVAAAHPRTSDSGLERLAQPASDSFASAQGKPGSASRSTRRSEDSEGTGAEHQERRRPAQDDESYPDLNEEEQKSSFQSELAEGLSFAPIGPGSGPAGGVLALQADGGRTSVQQSETPAGGEPSESRADVSRLDEKKQAAPIDSRSPQFDRPSDSGPIVSGEPRDEHGSDHQSYGAEEVPLKAPQSVAAPENAPSVSSAHSPAEPLKGELPDEAPSGAAPDHEDTRGSHENNGWGNDAGDREFHTGRGESAGHDVSDLHAEEFSAQDLGQHDSDGDWLQAIDGGGSAGSELPSDWLECIDRHSDGSKADKKEDLEDASGDHFVRGDEDDGKHHHGSHAA